MSRANSCDLIFQLEPTNQLSAPQRSALEALGAGGTFRQAADAAGVSRSTLYRWIDADPTFKPLWQAFQAELGRAAHARLMGLSDAAVSAVANAVEAGDARLSLTVLQRLGVFDAGRDADCG